MFLQLLPMSAVPVPHLQREGGAGWLGSRVGSDRLSRRGSTATSSLSYWREIGDPRVLADWGDLKEQREAVRMKRPPLAYAPRSEQAEIMRQIAREIS